DLGAAEGGGQHDRSPHHTADAVRRGVGVVHRRDHRDMVAHDDPPVRAPVSLEAGHFALSPLARMLSTLWMCTCATGAIRSVARPITVPYFSTSAPAAISRSANLWPKPTGSASVTA